MKRIIIMEIDKIIELLKVLVPVATTIITFIYTRRTSIRHAAKQSILQMIMEDQFNWELFRKFPVNYGNILDEYVVYHKNGGNGEVTKKVDEYKAWYVVNEDKMMEMKKYKCRPMVSVACDNLETAKKKK
jgi:hypothetical protein